MRHTLRVVPVMVFDVTGKTKKKKYALLDDGSDQSFITEKLANKLNLKGKKIRKKVSTLLQTAEVDCIKLDVTIQTTTKNKTIFRLKKMETIKRTIKGIAVNWQYAGEGYEHLEGIPFPEVEQDSEVDLLIGADNPELLRSLKEVYGGVDQPIARLTPLG